ncbi:dendritic arbor reduction protein 1-like isoform X2 [Anopheles aquasalis]|uniref:dendritic arbor reduction protein 1-like isoform X2 n=1 Tax=Anopheles aquasalis TaxID=42839 RepID=UPI00215B4437|nr:dendritic arbor reduction protein 1-like isoform X2 [Anopheles aquasalis]
MQFIDFDVRNELMGRLQQLEVDVKLDVAESNQYRLVSKSSLEPPGLPSCTNYNNEQNGKDLYIEDSFLRPPLWEDITSSIQNIDPENAIMLGTTNDVSQVKMEAIEDSFLEPLSSPLLSPLEIKTEKSHLLIQSRKYDHNINQHHNVNVNQNAHQQPHHSQVDTSCSNVSSNNHESSIFFIHSSASYTLNALESSDNDAVHSDHHSNLSDFVFEMNGTARSPKLLNSNAPTQPEHSTLQQQPPQQHHQEQQMYNLTHSMHVNQNNNYYSWPQSILNPNACQLTHSKYTSSLCSAVCAASISRLMDVPPLTPPNSDPGSPGNNLQHQLRRTPPPPYNIQQQHLQTPGNLNHLPQHSQNNISGTQSGDNTPMQTHHQDHQHLLVDNPDTCQNPSNHRNSSKAMGSTLINSTFSTASVGARTEYVGSHTETCRGSSSKAKSNVLTNANLVKQIVGRYNRRNNPELEKRRIHHCDYIGCIKVYTKSSHLKAHQRIHTVLDDLLI